MKVWGVRSLVSWPYINTLLLNKAGHSLAVNKVQNTNNACPRAVEKDHVVCRGSDDPLRNKEKAPMVLERKSKTDRGVRFTVCWIMC